MENHQALQKSNQIQLYATQTIDSEIAKKQQNETQSAERVSREGHGRACRRLGIIYAVARSMKDRLVRKH